MKIGYPCVNLSVACKSNRTFRLKSYSEQRLISTVENNLDCLLEILRFNVANDLLFFRITSDLVPFASHPICRFDWISYFEEKFQDIGDYIRTHNIRISMHPDQFTLINPPDGEVFERSLRELIYHAEVLDSMSLDDDAKIQIHVGGVYGDKRASSIRFIERFIKLPAAVGKRLVIENDDRSYTLEDCLRINSKTGIPVLFDLLHHEANNSGQTVPEAFEMFYSSWREKDGIPMVDYTSPRISGRKGTHSESIDIAHFREFLKVTKPYDFDIMLEIKDKEHSAIKAAELAKSDDRFSSWKHSAHHGA
jgi:UV DNA damage endonuclease